MSDPFVIYTLGDLSLFDGALNGVAMLFKDTDLYSGKGYLGLGYGAFFGAMILLTIMIYNAAFKQQMEIRALLAPLFVYILLTVPKVDVAVYDMYTNNVRKVDNIPIGLAIPTSVASGIGKILTEIFGVGYQVVKNNNYVMPKITDDGFVTPLKMINSLRTVAAATPSPILASNVKNFYKQCLISNPNFDASKAKTSNDQLGYILSVSKDMQGVVSAGVIQPTGGITYKNMTCEDAGNAIKMNIYASVDGTGLTKSDANMLGDTTKYNVNKLINMNLIGQGDATGATSKMSSAQVTGEDLSNPTKLWNNIAMLTGISESDGRIFVANTLLNPMLETASYCADRNSSVAQLSKCSAWVSSVNQWEEKNAAAATGFLKILKDAQNFLIIFSFLIFPIMVVFIMFQGTSSFKIIGSYLIFTMSAYLWLPIASIINFYIQSTLVDSFQNISAANGGIKELNMVTGPQFYAAVSQKLSLANGLLASTPILCMMIFMGMEKGMSGLTSRMNSAEGGDYDARANTPDAYKSSALASSNSAITTDGLGHAYNANTSKLSASTATTHGQNQTASQSLTSANSMAYANLETLSNAANALNRNSKNHSESIGSGVDSTQTTSTSNATTDSNNNSGNISASNAKGNSTDTSSNIGDSTRSTGQFNVSGDGGASFNQKTNENNKKDANNKKGENNKGSGLSFRANGSAGGSHVSSNEHTGVESASTGTNSTANISGAQSVQDSIAKSSNEAHENKLSNQQLRSTMNDITNNKELMNAISHSKDLQDAYQNLQSIAQSNTLSSTSGSSSAVTVTDDRNSLVNNIENNDGNGIEAIKNTANNLSENDKAKFDKDVQHYQNSAALNGVQGKNAVAMVLAAQQSNDANMKKAGDDYANANANINAVTGQKPTNVVSPNLGQEVTGNVNAAQEHAKETQSVVQQNAPKGNPKTVVAQVPNTQSQEPIKQPNRITTEQGRNLVSTPQPRSVNGDKISSTGNSVTKRDQETN